jgi:WD40 repeat protein
MPATRNTTLPAVGPANISLTFNPGDGFYTSSQLMYVITGRNVTVIAADMNKVVDVIYLDKPYVTDVAVSPDYTKLYVLYKAHANPELSDMGGYDESYYIFLLTIDLYSKQIVADTWFMGGYFDLIYGTASNMVISPDGRYLYFASNTGGGAMIFQYDTTLNAYTRGIEAENVQDLTLGTGGNRLYYADGELDRLYVVDLPGLSVSGYFSTIDVDMTPMTIAVNDQQNLLYIAGSVSGTTDDAVTSIDWANYDSMEKTGETTMLFSSYVNKIRLGPDRQRLFVVEPSDKQVVAYDVNKPWECSIYYFDVRPWDIKFSADGSKMYTWSPSSGKIIVQDLQTRQQVSGSPIVAGREEQTNVVNGEDLVMGPVPVGDIFVNDSAYKAHRLQALPNMATTISNVHYRGVLLSNNSVRADGSSFYRDSGTGNIVFFNMSRIATVTPAPTAKQAGSSPLPKVTVIPFPGLSGATAVPQENQTATATPQAGNNKGTPTPGTETGVTPTAKATPGLTAMLCLVCLTLAAVAAKRRTR